MRIINTPPGLRRLEKIRRVAIVLAVLLLWPVNIWAQADPMLSQPLTLEAKEAGAKVNFYLKSGVTGVEYSTDGGENWYSYISNTAVTLTNVGDKVSFRGTNSAYSNGGWYGISCTADCYVYGNIMSLINKENFATNTTLTGNYALANLFKNNTFIKNHSSKKLVLPATTLTNYCYSGMFYGCTGLTSAPELPATTLANYCYDQMFYNCTGLTSAPVLPATTLAIRCYNQMFYNCTGLTSAPELPATTLANYCYNYMFRGCTGLTSAPELPATTLAEGCYYEMFYGCTGLTSAPELPATTLADCCYEEMFRGCTGLTSAPELPATTLADCCYEEMFSGCTNLNKVICLANSYDAENYTLNWLNGVAATGTFIKANGMSSWGSGVSDIPSGWTVVNGVNNWTDLKSAMSVDNNIVLVGNCTDPSPSSTSYLQVNDGSTVNLDLNGYTIDHGLTSATGDGCVIVVHNGAALTITDSSTGKTGKITGGNNSDYGIEGYMGGGIFNKGSLTINGGSIEYNTDAELGGGIYNDGTLTINGGTITNNHAYLGGGGIYHGGNYFYLSGNPTISSNTKNGSAANNVYLDNFPIQITGTLSNTTPIGITMSSLGTFTSGLTAGNVDAQMAYFSSDNASYCLAKDNNNQLKLALPVAILKNSDGTVTKGSYPTITAAFEAAENTDKVILQQNTTENVTFSKLGGTTVTLDLNDKVITASSGSIITMSRSGGGGYATLNIVDNAENPTTRYWEYSGSNKFWTPLGSGTSSYVTSGGCITGGHNSVNFGGGIIVNYNTTLILNGGNVVGNYSSANGGGISVESGRCTIESGANVCGNYSLSNGGGIYMFDGILTINSATIMNNQATNGGGVYFHNSTLTINGATIMNNQVALNGGGVYFYYGTLGLTGASTITGNTLANGSTANNLYICDGKTINTVSFTSGASIGVTMQDPADVFTNGLGSSETVDTQMAYFYSDNLDYGVTKDNSYKLKLTSSVATRYTDATFATPVRGYATLTSAFNAAGNGEGVKLISDVVENVQFIKDGGTTVTLDLNDRVMKSYNSNQPAIVISRTGVAEGDVTLNIVDNANTKTTRYWEYSGSNKYWTKKVSGTSDYVTLGGCLTGSGAGINVYSNSVLNLNGGNVVGNHNEFVGGGGIYVTGTCNIESGVKICGNYSKYYGGGVAIMSGGQGIVNNNGSITHNYAKDKGGGVYVYQYCTFTNTGQINDNFAEQDGGGIWIDAIATAVNLNNGTGISGNKSLGSGGGVYVGRNINLSGAVVITGNVNTSDAANNLYLPTGKVVTITDDITDSNIGVTMQTPGVFTSGLSTNGTASNFTSDDTGKGVGLTGNEAYLGTLYTISTSASHGSVSASPSSSAINGATVTVTPTADAGYALTTLTYTPTGGVATAIDLASKQFTMPTANVTISATFALELTSATVSVPNAIYNGASQTATVKYGETVLTKGTHYTVTTGSDSRTNAGTTESFTITGTGDYTGTVSDLTFTVNQREVTLLWDDTELTYNGTAQKPTATAGNLANSDEIGVTVTGGETNAGEYTATASALTGDKRANYKLPTSVTQDFIINAKTLTISAHAKGKTYGDDDPSLTYTSSGLVSGGAITGSLSRAAGENVGTYAITQGTLTAGNNYCISYTGANLTISQANLSVTANGHSITYGDAPANDGVTYSPFVNDETAAVLGGTLDYDYTYAQYGDVGNYTITPKGLTSSNYNITFTSGTLTVEQKEVGLDWSNTSPTYSGSEQAPTATATGLVNGDEIGVTVTGGETNAGEYTATASALTGDKSANYKLPAANESSFFIGKVTLTVTAQDAERAIGSANPTFAVDYEGFVNSETSAVLTTQATATSAADASSSVGSYPITASGAVAANYVFTYVPGTLKVYRNFAFADSDWKTWYGAEDLEVDVTKMETYVVTEVTSSTITIESTNGEIYLNKPMLIKRKDSNMTDVRGYAPTSPISLSLELSPAYIGGVSSFADYTAGTVYTLAGTEFIRTRVTASTTFDPSKCFIFLASGGASSRLSISGDGTTGITPMVSDGTRDDWYTISGRKLSKRPKQPGVYIWNGKKVVIK